MSVWIENAFSLAIPTNDQTALDIFYRLASIVENDPYWDNTLHTIDNFISLNSGAYIGQGYPSTVGGAIVVVEAFIEKDGQGNYINDYNSPYFAAIRAGKTSPVTGLSQADFDYIRPLITIETYVNLETFCSNNGFTID